ncbi:MAG: ATP-binding protein [Paludibacteraceae bacterium]|nr:ATP-binding protein [Paludibacteraceae bacterium]
MNNESQNIEYKRIWQDDNIKSVCAFANSQGGVMYIGIDDDGQESDWITSTSGKRTFPIRLSKISVSFVRSIPIYAVYTSRDGWYFRPLLPCRATANDR